MSNRIEKYLNGDESSRIAFSSRSEKQSQTFDLISSQNALGDGSQRPDKSMKKFIESYGNFVWVYSAVYAIANAAAGVDLALFLEDKEGNLEQILDHPLLTLIKNPNFKCTQHDLIELTYTQLESTGNAFWELVRDEFGVPVEIYPLRPTRISIVPDPKNYIRNYTFEVNGKKIPLSVDDVMHFRYPDPNNDYWGISPLSAASNSLKQEENAIEYNKRFFSNSARPDVVFHVEGGMNKKNFLRMKAMIKKMFGGVHKAHSAAIIEGGTKVEKLGFAPKDLEFLNLRKFDRDEILSVFGVPPAMVGVFEQAIRANARVQIQTFWETTMIHKLLKTENALNHQLVPEFQKLEVNQEKKLVLKWVLADVSALSGVTKEKCDIVLGKVKNGVITRNEARLELGYETIPGLDTVFIPMNLQTLDNALAAPDQNPNQNPSGAELNLSQNIGISKEKADMIWKQSELIRQPFVKQARNDMQLYFEDLSDEIVKKLEVLVKYKKKKLYSKTISVETVFPVKENQRKVKEILEANTSSILRTSGNSAILEISAELQLGAVPGLVENSSIKDFIEGRAFSASTSITETTKKRLTKLLNKLFDEQATLATMRKEIKRELTGKVADTRIRTIVNTEMNTGLSRGRRFGMEQIQKLSPEINLRKIWISARDGKVRTTHSINDQQSSANPLEIDSLYPNGLLYPLDDSGPAEEVIECRCIETYVSGTILNRSLNGPLPKKQIRFLNGFKIVTVKLRMTYKERIERETVDIIMKYWKNKRNGKKHESKRKNKRIERKSRIVNSDVINAS